MVGLETPIAICFDSELIYQLIVVSGAFVWNASFPKFLGIAVSTHQLGQRSHDISRRESFPTLFDSLTINYLFDQT